MKKEKLLSPTAVFLLGVNSIIGSGIFLLAGKMYKNAGTWSILAIILAALSLTVIAFAYANMSKLYPQNGGAFVYAKESFGRFPGFIIGMVTWILGTVTLATEVSALLTGLKMILSTLNIRLIGLILIFAMGLVSYFGASILKKLDDLTSYIKILIVLAVIGVCSWLVRGVHFGDFVPNIATSSGFLGFLTAYGTVFFLYNAISFLPVNAEKMENPRKNLPRVMVRVMVATTIAYVLIQAITIGALGSRLTDYAVPAAVAFSKLIGPIGQPLVVSAIGLSIFGVLVTVAFNAPTILASLAMAHEDVPELVAKKSRFGTPTGAIVLTTLGAAAIFLSGNFIFLSGLTVFMSFVQYVSTGLANIKNKFIWTGAGTVVFAMVLLLSFTGQILMFGFTILAVLATFYFIVKLDDEARELWLKKYGHEAKNVKVNAEKQL